MAGEPKSAENHRQNAPLRRHGEHFMQIEIEAQNIKCGGCASAITTGLMEDTRIEKVEVDVASGRVTVEAGDDIRADIEAKLAALGYPPKA